VWCTRLLTTLLLLLFVVQDMGNVEAKAAGLPLHKFIDAFRYGLKSAVGR
jgi:hypothetical protein